MPSAEIFMATCPPCSVTSAPVPSVTGLQIVMSISGELKSSSIRKTRALATDVVVARGGVRGGGVALGACGFFGTVVGAGARTVVACVVVPRAIVLTGAGASVVLARAGALVVTGAVGGRPATVGVLGFRFGRVVACAPVVAGSARRS